MKVRIISLSTNEIITTAFITNVYYVKKMRLISKLTTTNFFQQVNKNI